MTLQVAKLKVIELKQELENRGLPTNGLKADLAERLQSHLDNQPKDDENTVMHQVEATKVMEANQEKADEEPTVMSAIHDAHAAEVEAVVPATTEKEAEAVPETTVEEESKPSEVQNAPQERMEDHAEETGAADEPVAVETAKADAQEDTKMDEVDAPTRSLYISNLIRPLTLPSVRTALLTYGEPITLWLDVIKTHAYVIFETTVSAQAVLEALQDRPFPHPDSRPVRVHHVPDAKVPTWIEEEERAWDEGRRRFELDVERMELKEVGVATQKPPPPVPKVSDIESRLSAKVENGDSWGRARDTGPRDAGRRPREGRSAREPRQEDQWAREPRQEDRWAREPRREDSRAREPTHNGWRGGDSYRPADRAPRRDRSPPPPQRDYRSPPPRREYRSPPPPRRDDHETYRPRPRW